MGQIGGAHNSQDQNLHAANTGSQIQSSTYPICLQSIHPHTQRLQPTYTTILSNRLSNTSPIANLNSLPHFFRSLCHFLFTFRNSIPLRVIRRAEKLHCKSSITGLLFRQRPLRNERVNGDLYAWEIALLGGELCGKFTRAIGK